MAYKKRYFNFNFLISLRRRAGLNQTELSKEIGVSLTTISNWETGVKSPSRKHVDALADYFNVDHTLFLSKFD